MYKSRNGWQSLLNQMTKHKWASVIPALVFLFWVGRYFAGRRMQRCYYRCPTVSPLHWWSTYSLSNPFSQSGYTWAFQKVTGSTWLSLALRFFRRQRREFLIPLKSYPQDPSLYYKGHNGFPPRLHTHVIAPGRPQKGNTWQPRAARRNPRTAGDAGAAPVTIMRTHPPRLACGERGDPGKVCAAGRDVQPGWASSKVNTQQLDPPWNPL